MFIAGLWRSPIELSLKILLFEAWYEK
jgi:hypothetical protein